MISRLRLLLAIMLTLLVVFTGRLMYLQLAMAEEFTALSTDNYLEQRRIRPLRGRILARDGTVLADNRIAVDLLYWGGEIKQWDRISHMLEIEEPLVPPDLSDTRQRREGRVVAWNIPDQLVPTIEELVAGQENLYLRERIERTYPTNLASHVVGYTAEGDAERFPGYELGDLVGQMGIERSYQESLFGQPGAKIAEINSHGVTVSSDEIFPAEPGQDIVLTIDPQIQHMAEQALENSRHYVTAYRASRGVPAASISHGALIALNPKTGEILAMASSPHFDQNVFTKRPTSSELVRALLEDSENLPLSNRALEAFSPASTFKLVTSSALLEHGHIGPNTRYECSATYNFLGITFRNWATHYRGNYNVRDAIADSCNTFYWRAAAATPGATRGWGTFSANLANRAREFGFGAPVGIGLREEKSGRIPDDEWAREYYDYGWLPGFTLNMSIGQGDVQATPIQVAQLISTLAMSGRQVQPTLIREIGGNEVLPDVREVPGQHWRALQEGMRQMVTDYPTPRRYLGPGNFPIDVAGKTGTAQTRRGEEHHAWFMGYGPYQDPELAVVVFIEHGGSSTQVAIPVARDFMAAYWGVETE